MSVRLGLSLCVLSVITLSGFTCSKQVPVYEPPKATDTEEGVAGSSESVDGAAKTSENEDVAVPQEGMPEAVDAEHSDNGGK